MLHQDVLAYHIDYDLVARAFNGLANAHLQGMDSCMTSLSTCGWRLDATACICKHMRILDFMCGKVSPCCR